MLRSDWDAFSGLLDKTDGDDLTRMGGMINARRRYLDAMAARRFSIGDPVDFESRGKTYSGVVKKINPRTVIVEMDHLGPPWKVDASLLRPVKVGTRAEA